jgi:hypothetical protein
MTRPIISHAFRGKRYQVWGPPQRSKFFGSCDDPKDKRKKIQIPINGKRLFDLDTIIHESVHACEFDLAEEAVDGLAEATSKLLWRLGWRKEK